MNEGHPASDSTAPVTKADLLRWRLATEEAPARPDGHPSREPDQMDVRDLLKKQDTKGEGR